MTSGMIIKTFKVKSSLGLNRDISNTIKIVEFLIKLEIFPKTELYSKGDNKLYIYLE